MGEYFTTPLTIIRPEAIQVLPISSGLMKIYQNQMSRAIWRPAPGRKLGFVVTQDEALLGLIFLASPVIRLKVRDAFLFSDASTFNLREYMDLSVCVAAQPIGWHWNLGKLMALIAPTLGDYVETRYPNDEFKGVTTTSLYGRGTQYNRIYKFLGFTKGHGHEHITDVEYRRMVRYLRKHCPHCTPRCENPTPIQPSRDSDRPVEDWCAVPGTRFSDLSNARMLRIAAYRQVTGDKTVHLTHGKLRGVYYHPAVPPDQRPTVIQEWYERWGRPRYERMKDQVPPYQSGLDMSAVQSGEPLKQKLRQITRL